MFSAFWGPDPQEPRAPVTTLVVKDRVTGHNPVSVLYGQNFYHKRLQTQQVETARQGGKKGAGKKKR